jgi:hypothetical protein
VAFDAVAGQTYRIAISNYECYEDEESGELVCERAASWFEVTGMVARVPRNDAFRHARRVHFPGAYGGDLADATQEPGEPLHYPVGTLWYRFRPSLTTKVTMRFGVGGEECSMWLYRGRKLGHLHLVGRGDNGVLYGPMRVTVRRGIPYRLALGCAAMIDGHFVLNLLDGAIDDRGNELELDPPLGLRELRTQGLELRIASKRRESVTIEVRVGPRTARRLGVASRLLGRRTVMVDVIEPADKPAVLRLTPAARRALKHAGKLRAVVRLTTSRTGASTTTLTLPPRPVITCSGDSSRLSA